ncbi:MAG: histidinol dehydrogenase [bacterium]
MNLPIREWSSLDDRERARMLARSERNISEVHDAVADVIAHVRRHGDAALRELTRRFDGANLDDSELLVSQKEIDASGRSLSPEVRDALDFAIENVRRYHAVQLPPEVHTTEVRPGILAGERRRPIPSVGLYVPRGRGSFPSMVYMLAMPAHLAGVGRIVVATPPGPEGEVDAACLYAARQCGVHQVLRVGGAQAVAALAYGTESVAPVRKIMGPGSVYVAAAMRQVAGDVHIGLPAGPSEAVVLADKHADPWRISLDLMIEAEHGSDSSALLVTPSRAVAEAVAEIIPALAEEIPEPRLTFLTDSLTGYGGIIVTADMAEAVDVVNAFGPEHLQVQTADPYDTISGIENAGEILIGAEAAFSIANYATGANAVLPTGGNAATWSPVSVRDFLKFQSLVHVTPQGYRSAERHVVALADYEGFHTHAAALRRRFDSLGR